VCRGFKPLHALFPLAGRLVRIFCPIIEVAVLPMFDTGQDLARGRPVASQVIGSDDPWGDIKPFSSLRKNFFAAFLSRRCWTRMSRILLSWSTAR
jgi:hypothetical protein